MSELVTKSVPPEQQEQRIGTRIAVKRIGGFTIVATAVAVLAVLGAVVLYAQSQDNDKYSLKSPSGIAFSDFRGYEDWAVVSSAHTDERLKVIVGKTATPSHCSYSPSTGRYLNSGDCSSAVMCLH